MSMLLAEVWDLADRLNGTCDDVETALEKAELFYDPDEVIDALLDVNIERCPSCHWWMESHELVTEDGNPAYCKQCREEGYE